MKDSVKTPEVKAAERAMRLIEKRQRQGWTGEVLFEMGAHIVRESAVIYKLGTYKNPDVQIVLNTMSELRKQKAN